MFRFSEGIARVREPGAAKPRDARNECRSPRSLSRLAPSAMCVVISCVAPFARRTQKKERLLLVYEKLAILSLKLRSHFRILLHQTWVISHSKVTREPGSALGRIAPWDCFGDAVASIIGRLRIHLPAPPPTPPPPHRVPWYNSL